MQRSLPLAALLLAASAFTAGCNSMGHDHDAPEAAAEEVIITKMGDERTARLRGALEAFTRNDQAYTEGLLAPGHMIFMADGSEGISEDEWKTFADASHRAFKDMEFANLAMNTTDYPEYGAWTYAWCTFRATSRATGETSRFPLHIMWQWDGDQVVREFHYADTTRFNELLESTLAGLDG